MKDLLQLLYALGLTILIEYPIIQLIWLLSKEKSSSKLVFVDGKCVIIPVLIVNVLTNPAINLYARYLWRNTNIPENTIWLIISLYEIAIFLIEGIMYKYLLKTKLSKAIAMSLCANGISYLSSFII